MCPGPGEQSRGGPLRARWSTAPRGERGGGSISTYMSWVNCKVYFFLSWGEEGLLAAGRGADGGARCQVAKCLSTSKKPETSGARRHRASCQLRHVATRRPLPKGALVGGTQYFFPNSLNICSLFSPKLKRAEWPRVVPDKRRHCKPSLPPHPPQKTPSWSRTSAGNRRDSRTKPEPPSKDLDTAALRTAGVQKPDKVFVF